MPFPFLFFPFLSFSFSLFLPSSPSSLSIHRHLPRSRTSTSVAHPPAPPAPPRLRPASTPRLRPAPPCRAPPAPLTPPRLCPASAVPPPGRAYIGLSLSSLASTATRRYVSRRGASAPPLLCPAWPPAHARLRAGPANLAWSRLEPGEATLF
jgi:hypothetical protein